MVSDDADRGKTVENWMGAFRKSLICDAEKLEETRNISLETNEGRLLEGLVKTDDTYFFATLEYIRQLCRNVMDLVTSDIHGLYFQLSNHAGGNARFPENTRRGGKILKNIQTNMKIEKMNSWNLHTVNCVKSFVLQKGKAGKAKGITIVVINTGAGGSFLEFLGDLMYLSNRVRQLSA